MIVDIDIGNTRIKWRFADIPHSFAVLDSVDELPESWRCLPDRPRFRISSVVGLERTREFADRLMSLGDSSVEIALVKSPFAGMELAYGDVASFGVDRWLALLAARSRCPQRDCVVVHAGTALVADFLRSDGRHLGGFIAAGLRASLSAIGGAAHALGAAAAGVADFRCDQPGRTTIECIEAGTALLVRGFLRELDSAASLQFDSPKWIFTGGDAALLMALGQYSGERGGFASGRADAEFVQELVLEGLAIALP